MRAVSSHLVSVPPDVFGSVFGSRRNFVMFLVLPVVGRFHFILVVVFVGG